MEYLKLTSPLHGGPVVDAKPEKPDDVAAQVCSVLRGFGNGDRTK